MKADALTLLGCSGSVALMLMAGAPAQANTDTIPLRQLDFVSPEALQQDSADGFGCSCSQSETESPGQAIADLEGDLAIAQWGCDCAGCRYMVRDMIASGEISMPR